MVDGHSSTVSSLKTDTWLPKNAHHTKERPRETTAQTTLIALLIQRLRKLDSSERATVTLLKRKWCKKLLETDWLTESLMHHIFSICTLKVFLQLMESKNFTKRLFLLLKSETKMMNLQMKLKVPNQLKLLPRKERNKSMLLKTLQTKASPNMVSNGKIWITLSLY